MSAISDGKTEPNISRPRGKVAALLGSLALALWVGSVLARIMFGTNRIGPTAVGSHLIQRGFPVKLAAALDFGDPSVGMAIAELLALIAIISGLVALFRKGKKGFAATGIVTGSLVIGVMILLIF